MNRKTLIKSRPKKLVEGKTLSECMEMTGLSERHLRRKLNDEGKNINEISNEERNCGKPRKFIEGRTLDDWCKITGFSARHLRRKLNTERKTINEILDEKTIKKVLKPKKIGLGNERKKIEIKTTNKLNSLREQHAFILEELEENNELFGYATGEKRLLEIANKKISLLKDKEEIEDKLKKLSDGSFEKEKFRNGFIYIVELFNERERFAKIGISTSPPDTENGRWNSFVQTYKLGKIRLHREVESFYHARLMENKLHNYCTPYEPKEVLDGKTECFVIDYKLEEVLNNIGREGSK